MKPPHQSPRVKTGIPEFDFVLKGGLPEGRVHLVEGRPGTGKTTMAMRFLVDGAQKGDACLYVSLSESEADLRATADSHGWNLDGVSIMEIRPAEELLERQQSVFASGEFGFGRTVGEIAERIRKTQPKRVVIDSVAELRLMAEDVLRYRRQLMVLRRHLQSFGGTTLVLSDTTDANEYDLQAMVHGVVSLEMTERNYGASRRRMRIVKLRGADFQSGWHDFVIQQGELLVFPSLIADEHGRDFEPADESTGVPALDHLLGEGLGRGSTTMLIGPSGVGKSSLAMHCLIAATRRGQHAACFSFDESHETVWQRAKALGLDFEEQVQRGTLYWERANPSRISPGEFVWKVRRQVEDHDARVVVIDSMNSYLETMPEERALMLQMHELLTYLSNQGVIVLLILAQKGVVGSVENPMDLSFLSDTLVLMRFFEAGGEIHRAITVVKKRSGPHQKGVHRFWFGEGGMHIDLDEVQPGALVSPSGTATHTAAGAHGR